MDGDVAWAILLVICGFVLGVMTGMSFTRDLHSEYCKNYGAFTVGKTIYECKERK